MLKRIALTLFMLVAFGSLAACDTAEERAEKHFESAMSLLEQGDQARAVIEFRNVFKLNGRHKEARRAFAELQQERGNIGDAFGQYLRLVEQYPDDLDGLIAVSELAFEIKNWDEMLRHVSAAYELAPDNTKVQGLKAAADYTAAAIAEDEAARIQALADVNDLKGELPEFLILRQVIIDDLMRKSDLGGAIAELDKALELEPRNLELHQIRLTLLSTLGEGDAIEAQLVDMVALYPQDASIRETLVRWYVALGQLDKAEEFLRAAIDPQDDDTTNQLTLIRFLSDLRSPAAALSELDAVIAGGNEKLVYRALRAGLVFEHEDEENGIAEMRVLLASTEPSDEQRDLKIGLARMLVATGNVVGARALVEEILVDDPSNVEALKQKAGWLIDDDKVGEAIVGLRTALDQKPRDPGIMTLMARAYERDGNVELVGEMLSLAVDASNAAPEESIRYAEYLTKRDKDLTAEEILIDALRIVPQNLEILSALGGLYVKMQDWARAEQVASTLTSFETEDAKSISDSITATILQSQNKSAEAISFLEGLIAQGDAGIGAHIAIVRSHMENNDADKAIAYIDNLLADDPNNLDIQFIQAGILAASGDTATAEGIYRDLLTRDETQSQVWIALFRLLSVDNRVEEAEKTISDALKILPEEETLQWIQAGIYERKGDIPGAIAIYETMYAANSDNLVVANNLASLISNSTEDVDAINRAYTIARRLRSVQSPAFQDTFGWIAFLRGENNVAIDALEFAAEGLKDDPTVQYHLARAYLAAERNAEALAQFIVVKDMVGAVDTRAFVQESRDEIIRLQALEKQAPEN